MEFREACLLLGELSCIPDDEIGKAWALDMLTVGFRAAAVALLADHGLYVFSFPKILAQLWVMGLLSRSEMDDLRALRGFKAAYRSDVSSCAPRFDDVRKLIDIVSRCLRLGLHVGSQSDDDVMHRVLDRQGSRSQWYRDSRLLELATQRLSPRAGDIRQFVVEKQSLLRILRRPTQYGGFMKSSWQIVQQRFSSLYAYSAA